MCVALVLAYALQLLLGLTPIIDPSDRGSAQPAREPRSPGLGVGTGALLFAGTLAAHGDRPGRACWGAFAAGSPSAPAGR